MQRWVEVAQILTAAAAVVAASVSVWFSRKALRLAEDHHGQTLAHNLDLQTTAHRLQLDLEAKFEVLRSYREAKRSYNELSGEYFRLAHDETFRHQGEETNRVTVDHVSRLFEKTDAAMGEVYLALGVANAPAQIQHLADAMQNLSASMGQHAIHDLAAGRVGSLLNGDDLIHLADGQVLASDFGHGGMPMTALVRDRYGATGWPTEFLFDKSQDPHQRLAQWAGRVEELFHLSLADWLGATTVSPEATATA
jgi:hypothetical protein